MTPEHRAELMALLRENQPLKDFEELIERVIASERAACAQIAEGTAGGHYMARVCASAIRAYGKDEQP